MNVFKSLKNGIIDENPTFRLVLGMCPTLAVTTSIQNAVGMGLAASFVLIFSNIAISALKDFIPENVRIPAYVVVIAAFVTIVQLLLAAFLPALNDSLGIFIPLIVVNCIILARAETFASKNGVLASALDGLSIGIGFTLALVLVSAVRELLGKGTLMGIAVLGGGYEPMLIMVIAPGGFLTLGLLMAGLNKIGALRAAKREGGDKA